MKTKEELIALKEEVEALNRKLAELSEDELAQVIGGHDMPKKRDDEKYVMQTFDTLENDKQYEYHFYP